MCECGSGNKRSKRTAAALNVIAASDAPPPPAAAKIVLMGDKATGKSSIVARFTTDSFAAGNASTIGAAFASKDVKLANGSVVKLSLWDTAGEELFRAMTRSFFRDAAIGIIVFDVTSASSFTHVPGWLADFKQQCPESLAVLVANKLDLVMGDGPTVPRIVPSDEARSLAEASSMKYFEVSAKSGEGVVAMFSALSEQLGSRGEQGLRLAAAGNPYGL